MIAHVAEAGEGRGRVVLRLDPAARLSEVALEAAVRLAQAFQSEIESVLVEDQKLFELASFPFAREVSLSGSVSRAVCAADIEREVRFAATALQRRVEQVARLAKVQVRRRIVRDEPVQALVATCAENGPWNVITLAEPFAAAHEAMLRALFDAVWATTGIVIVGPKAQRTTGPVVVAVEAVERLPPMLRAAERIAGATAGPITLLLAAEDREQLHWIEGQARLALGEIKGIKLEGVDTSCGPAAIAERLRRLKCGFVIAQFGGLVIPYEGSLRPLGAALECPLLLVR